MKKKIASLFILLTVSSIAATTFAAQLNFTPRTSVTEEYTDNVFLDDNDKEDDFITTVSAGFTASLLGRTSGLELSADPGYAFYQDFTENDAWRLPATLRAWTSPSSATRFEIGDNFIRTEEPIDPEDRFSTEDGPVEETGDTTVRRQRNTYYRNTARFRASHRFGREDQVYAGFTYGLLRNEDGRIEDNDNYTPFVGLDYWFTQWFGSELYGAYTRGEFSQDSDFVGVGSSDFNNYAGTVRLLGRLGRHFSLFVQHDQIYRHFINGVDNDYKVYAPSAGFTYVITEDMYLRLGLGYYYQDIENEDDENNIFSNAEISKTWNYQRGSINLAGLSGLTQNDFGAQNQGFQQFAAIQGSASYNFTRQLIGDASAYYRYSHTPGGEDAVDDDNLDTHQIQATAGLGYMPLQWMTIRLGYEFNKYDASGDDDYTENRGLLTVTLQPDRPWRF